MIICEKLKYFFHIIVNYLKKYYKMSIKIYGKQWGEYPSDSELDIDDCCDHYFTYLCTDDCKNEKTIENSSDIISSILNDIMEIVEEAVVYREKPTVDYYTEQYGIIPVEWRDENGELIGMVYYSNSPETRKLWGVSLTIRMDGDSSDEEYDDGDVADYHRHRQIYRD